MEFTFYKLQIGNKCYVGSTENFKHRMSQHKCRCYNEKDKKHNCKVYQYIRQNNGWENVKVMIIDKIIYNDKDEAREMETKFMLMFNAELNSKYPKRSQKDYVEANKEKIAKQRKEPSKEYYEANKEKIAERNKEKVACDICGKTLKKYCMSKHKKSQH